MQPRNPARRRPGQQGLAGHLALLFKVLFGGLLSRLPKHARLPRLRRWARGFRQDVKEVGIGVASVPEGAVAALRAAAAELYRDGGEDEPEDSRLSFSSSGGLNGAFPSTMTWHWAQDQATLDLFRPAADAIRAQLGKDYELIGGSFVVANGGCGEREAKFHLDFGPPMIPRLTAVTALLPLHPAGFPERSGNLEYRPQGPGGAVYVHRYTAGQAAVFDGKLSHRTQPFAAEAFAAGGGEAPLRGKRVLASFSLAKVPPCAPWRPALEEAPARLP